MNLYQKKQLAMGLISRAALALLLLAPPNLWAWGQTGHRVTGGLAEPLLSAEAQQLVRGLLGPESLAEASTWADEMRSAPGSFWQKTANPWHYVTVPKGQDYEAVGAPPEGDAVTALARYRARLLNPTLALEVRREALRLIVHYIGDLHQPLHAGNGTDRGGNDVRVRYFGKSTNLHRVWDSSMIDGERLSYTEWVAWLAPRLDGAFRARYASIDPKDWIGESVALRDQVYPDGDRLSYDYIFQHKDALRTRLMAAGWRIAAYLNAACEAVPAACAP